MFCGCYLRKGVVYIPTLGKIAGGGGHLGIEPVAAVAVTDTEMLRSAFHDTFTRGNPTVPAPRPRTRADYPKSVLLKYAGVQTDSAFVRGASVWWLNEDQGLYKIRGLRKGPHGGFVLDRDREIKFPAGTSVETVIDRMIAILQSV